MSAMLFHVDSIYTVYRSKQANSNVVIALLRDDDRYQIKPITAFLQFYVNAPEVCDFLPLSTQNEKSKHARVPIFIGEVITVRGPGGGKGTHLRVRDFAVVLLMPTRTT